MKKWHLWSIGLCLLAMVGLGRVGVETSGPAAAQPAKDHPKVAKPDPDTLQLVFPYGSEKEGWIKEITAEFNAAGEKVSGKKVKVVALPMGSGECVDMALNPPNEDSRPHIISPASGAFVTLGNAQSQAKSQKNLCGKTKNLCLSPVVIAMWKPMAEAMGWPKKEIGWADLRALANNDKGWAAYDRPQWGKFKFGHTHPDYSNSGLISVLAECYAGSGKTDNLTADDVAKAADFVRDIEKSVVHYGSSTGFFGKKMFANGPEYLSAAVLYESMVVESYDVKDKPFDVVAVYPKEGTFWSDHPFGVVNREWVTDDHKAAAAKYLAVLLSPANQKKALKYGFRPGLESVGVSAPIDAAHGCDPKKPTAELGTPENDVIEASVKLWKKTKKRAQVTLVLDTSGSMQIGGRLTHAKAGAKQMLSMLDNDDEVGILAFSTAITWMVRNKKVGGNREALDAQIDSIIAGGETALYDACKTAYDEAAKQQKAEMIQAVVVLTDGEDNKSKLTLEAACKAVKIDHERRPIRIFTIAYGDDADVNVLKKISDATEAKSYEGNPKTIRAVFSEIGTFF